MKKIISLLLILCLALGCFVGCEDKVRQKETEGTSEENSKDKSETYSLEEALEHDKLECDTVRSCFNAAMTWEEVFKEVAAGTGYFIIEFQDDDMKLINSDKYSALGSEIEPALKTVEAPKEKGKVAYCISWYAENTGSVSEIKVITVSRDEITNIDEILGIDKEDENVNIDDDIETTPVIPGNEIEAPENVVNNDDAKKIELKVWAPTEEHMILKVLCMMFDGAHPEYDITFFFEEYSEADVYNYISKDKENAGDVFYFANDQLPYLVKDGYIMALPEEGAVRSAVEENIYKDALETCKVDEVLYSIPFTSNAWYLFYNKSMFTEDEVNSLDIMMSKDIEGCDYNFAMPMNNGWYLGGFFLGGGCTLFGENGDDPSKCDWASDRGVAIVKYLNSIVASGKFYNDNGTGDAIALLAEGKCASFATGAWNSMNIKEALGDNFGVVKLPMFSYEVNGEIMSKEITPFNDYKSIGIKSNTKYPEEALLLAEFLTGAYAQEVRAKARALSPTHKAVIERVDVYGDPVIKAGVEQMSTVVNRPRISQMSNYWQAANKLGLCIVECNDYVVSGDDKILELLETIVNEIVE